MTLLPIQPLAKRNGECRAVQKGDGAALGNQKIFLNEHLIVASLTYMGLAGWVWAISSLIR